MTKTIYWRYIETKSELFKTQFLLEKQKAAAAAVVPNAIPVFFSSRRLRWQQREREAMHLGWQRRAETTAVETRFHQVDSDNVTIAVNFWWKSNIMSNILEHMDAYYIRRLLNRLVGKEMNYMLQKSSVSNLEGKEKCENANEGAISVGIGQNSMPQKSSVSNLEGREKCDSANEGSKGCHEFDSNSQMESASGNGKNHWPTLQELEPFALSMLYELISLVHDAVKVGGKNEGMECTSLKDSLISLKSEYRQSTMDSPPLLTIDPVASIFSSVEPLVLKTVLLAMAHQFPRTLEALILHVLSPIGAEVLTRKFDEMDQQVTNEQQIDFYQIFYSVFDNPNAAMDVILKRKEAFAFQAVQNVLDQYLGLHVDRPQ